MKNQSKVTKAIMVSSRGLGGLTKGNIKASWRKLREKIDKRLGEFRNLCTRGNKKDLFAELAFCIFTPQSKAISCLQAVEKLRRQGLLFEGNPQEISKEINTVRFKNKKALYLVEARKKLLKSDEFLKKLFHVRSVSALRRWLVSHIKGMGLKEAGHFLRNVGLGRNIAILDRHVLRNLKELGVIRNIPASLPERKYLDIEKKMKAFSKRIGIPLEHLDLLFWARETGKILK